MPMRKDCETARMPLLMKVIRKDMIDFCLHVSFIDDPAPA